MVELWDPRLKDDLRKFVMFAFPWGKRGTPLENFKEPRKWQIEELERMTEHIAKQKNKIALGIHPEMYKSATASGRGVGKSALTAWLNWWFLTTRLGGTAITTANTEAQLKSRTWAEMGKWHTLAINSHWFERTALSLNPADWFKEALAKLKIDTGYYYGQAQIWNEESPDSFAGVHNQAGVLLVMDEGSGIPEPIWTVSEGFFTEPILDRYHFAFSNPRRNTGSFFECFHRYRNYWYRRNLDSRTVEGTDHTLLNQIVEKYGEDSDEARIEVKGEFPRQGDRQFISRELAENARVRELDRYDDHAALCMGVDPARYGDDSTVICFRRGRDARSIPAIKLKGADNMVVANKCAELITKYNPDAVFIDGGAGAGIIDRLKEMGYKVHEVLFGGASESQEFADHRTELWSRLREWLSGGMIPADQELVDDLTGPQYKFQGISDRLKLESKEEMKKRGLSSPDNADALAVTFHAKVARKDLFASRRRGDGRSFGRERIARDVDYDVFG